MYSLTSGIPQSAANPLIGILTGDDERRAKENAWRLKATDALDQAVLDYDGFIKGKPAPPLDFAADPDTARKQGIVASYLQIQAGGRPISTDPVQLSILRDRVADQQFAGRGKGDDLAFYGEIEKETTGRHQARVFFQDLAKSAAQSALMAAAGEPAAEYPAWMAEARQRPGYRKDLETAYLTEWRQRQRELKQQLDPVRDLVARQWQAMKEGKTADLGGLSGYMANEESREVLLYAIGGLVKALPKEQQPSVLANLRKQFLRRDLPANLEGIQRSMRPFDRDEPLPEDYLDQLEPGYDLEKFNKVKRAEFERDSRARDRFLRKLESIVNDEYDPIVTHAKEGSNWAAFEKGLYAFPGVVLTVGVNVLPGAGRFASYEILRQDSTDQARAALIQGGMDEDAADLAAADIGFYAGLIQLPMESLGISALTNRLPFINRAVNRITTGLATRYLARAGSSAAVEFTTEMGQNLVPSIIQDIAAAASQDIPETQWTGEGGVFQDYDKQSLEVLGAILPLSLIMAGGGVFRDQRIQTIAAADDLTLRAAGMSDEAIASLRAATGIAEQEVALEAAWQSRDINSPDAQAAQQELTARVQAEQSTAAAASDNGIMPRAVRGTDGTWTLYDTATGSEIGQAPDWQRAAQLATTHANFTADQDADRIALVFSTYQAAEVSGQWGTDTNRPTEYNLDLGTELTAAQAAAASESARQRVAAQERLMGGDGSVTNMVFGQSSTDTAAGQMKTVNRILEGASVLEVFEEETHGFRRQAHARGILTPADDLAFLRALDTVLAGRTTREGAPLQILPADFDTLSPYDQEVAIDEGLADVMKAEILRTRKGGGQRSLPAGFVSNNLSALARLLGDRTLGKFRSFINAIREYFGLAIDRAAQIQRGLADGTLDRATYEGYLAKLLGVDEQIDYDQQARDAESAILDGAELAPVMDGDPFSLGQRTTVTPNASTRAFPGAEGSPSVIGPASFSIRAHHGTPHKVDRFSTGKIGTGEGAQAYGWGLYFAEAQEVASSYRKAGRNLGIIKDGDGQWWTTDGPKTIAGPFATSREAEAVAEAPAGNLYTVTLKVEDDQLLDWDKPLSEQPEAVRSALANYRPSSIPEGRTLESMDGKFLYRMALGDLADSSGPDAAAKAASALFASRGIRGIRFLDGNSRGKAAASIFEKDGVWNVVYNDPANGMAVRTDTFATEAEAKALVDGLEGSYNYVIFDEADIEILEENGQPVAPSFSLGSRPVASAHNHIAQTLQANDAGGYATAVETDPLEGGKVRTIAKLFHRMFKPAERIDFNRHWKGSKKNFEPGQEKKFNADVSRSAGRVLEVLRLAHAMFPNFQSWYETRIKMALDIFGEMDPDAAKPENNFILRVLLAVTSNGNTVKEQTEDSWKVYQSWKSTGKMGGVAVRGTRAAEIGKALGRMDLLIESHGWEKMDQFLARTGTVKELRQTLVDDFGFTAEEAAKLTTGELIDEQVPFALIFGAKLGSFFNNLSGNFDTTTMDRWFMRTFARAMGMQLLPVDKADIQEKRDRLQSALAAARSNPEAAFILKAAGVRANAPANQKTTVALADYFEKAANRENLNSKADELRLAVNGLYKIEDGFQLVEAPQSGGHRRFIRLAMDEARTTFSKESGKDWNAAELQALLWYFEKSVHEAYGSKQRDQSPDYGSAANELFRGRNGADARAFKPSDAVRRGKLEGGSMGLMGGQNAAGQEVAPSFSLGSRRLGVLTQDSIRRIQNPLRRVQAMERVSRKLEDLRLEAERLELLSGTKRLKRSLAREAAIRQALRREELENEAWARHAAILSDDDLTKLRAQPGHAALADPSSPLRGRLLSRTAAAKKHPDLFQLHQNPAEYEGSERVSRTLFGGTLTPDLAAEELFAAGLLREASTDALWQLLESEARHVASMKKVLEAAKADLREARTVAKAETNAWLATQVDTQATTYSPRQEILRSLAALDAILSSVPAEIRGKVGGYVQAARIADPDAGLQFLRERLAKTDAELEKYLKSQYNLEFLALLDRARPEKDEAGKKPRGKITPEMHALFREAEDAMTMTGQEAEARALQLEEWADNGIQQPDGTFLAVTAEEENHLRLTASMVRLSGHWSKKTAGEREAAVIQGTKLFEGGYMARKIELARQREKRAKTADNLQTATKATGNDQTRRDRRKKEDSRRGAVSAVKASMLSFEGVLQEAFGLNTAEVEYFANWERRAANAKHDALKNKFDLLDDLLSSLAGSKFKGEQLRYSLQDPSKVTWTDWKGNANSISELQAVAMTMMWRQEDGRRHMEGHLDEVGKPIGDWHHRQQDIDAMEDQLSDNAKRIRLHLTETYAAEWERINAVFEQNEGISLPRHKFYAPITVDPAQASGNQMLDPTTGMVASPSFTLGSLRNRSQTAIAKPNFDADAIQIYLGHVRQMEHYIAYSTFAREMVAVTNRREVRQAIQETAGPELQKVLGKWLDYYSTGSVMDPASIFRLNRMMTYMLNNFAASTLIGRVGVLAIQSTQLLAAWSYMPTGAYLSRLGRLMAGRLDWSGALNSEYIQRRRDQMPATIQQLMEGLKSGKPSRIVYAQRKMGETIAGADALFTAGTFAITYDYHLTRAKKQGMTGQQAIDYALQQAEAATDRVAQPTRPGTRSILEVNMTNAAFKMMWNFASDARQKLAIAVFQHADRTPMEKARAIGVVWLMGGVVSSIIRAAMRDARDDGEDDEIFDEKNWDPSRLALQSLAGPLNGLPYLGKVIEDSIFEAAGEFTFAGGTPLDNVSKGTAAAKRVLSGDVEDMDQALRDAEAILSAGALGSDKLSAGASFSHLARDIFGFIRNATGTD
jgi:hypothetical protein